MRWYRDMGKLKASEWIMSGNFLLLLLLWIFGRKLGINSTSAAFVGLGVLLVSGALTWSDILQEKRGRWAGLPQSLLLGPVRVGR